MRGRRGTTGLRLTSEIYFSGRLWSLLAPSPERWYGERRQNDGRTRNNQPTATHRPIAQARLYLEMNGLESARPGRPGCPAHSGPPGGTTECIVVTRSTGACC